MLLLHLDLSSPGITFCYRRKLKHCTKSKSLHHNDRRNRGGILRGTKDNILPTPNAIYLVQRSTIRHGPCFPMSHIHDRQILSVFRLSPASFLLFSSSLYLDFRRFLHPALSLPRIAVALLHACLGQRLLVLKKASEVMVVVMAYGSMNYRYASFPQ